MNTTHSPSASVVGRLVRNSALLALLSLGTTMACVVAPEEDGPQEGTIGVTKQAFSHAYYGQAAVVTPTTLSFNTELVTYQTHTCFLTAVHGNMHSHNQTVDVRVRPWWGDNKTWQLYVAPDSNDLLEGTAACVPRTTNRTPEVQYSGGNAVELGDATNFPNRKCFLTGVRGREKAYTSLPKDFAANGDYLKVFKKDGKWWLGGSGNVAGFARCVDVVDRGDAWYSGGTGTIDLEHTSGDVCFLTEVGGPFTTNSFTNGVSVYLDGGTLEWKLEADNTKRAGTTCAR